jgi:mRNA interferase RelE/StbE
LLHRRAARYFDRLEERLRAQLREKLEKLARDPLAMPGVKPMQGEWNGFYRLRHGDLRVIYALDPTHDAVVIAHIGPRGDAYK